MSQFLEECPKKWHSRIVEAANLDLNTSDQIKQILDATKHELLTNKWSKNEDDEQVAYVNRGRSDKKDQNQTNARHINKGRSMSRSRAPIVCITVIKRVTLRRNAEAPLTAKPEGKNISQVLLNVKIH